MQPLLPPSSQDVSLSDLPTLIRRRASFSQRPTTSSTTANSIAYTHEGKSPSIGMEQRSPLMDIYDFEGAGGRDGAGSGQVAPSGYGLGFGTIRDDRGQDDREETIRAGSTSETSSPSLYSPRAQHVQQFAQDSTPAWGARANQNGRSTYYPVPIASSSRSATPTAGQSQHQSQSFESSSSISEAERYKALMASPSPSTDTGTTTSSASPISSHQPSFLDTTEHLIRPKTSFSRASAQGVVLDLSNPVMGRGTTPPPINPSMSLIKGSTDSSATAGGTPQRPARNRKRNDVEREPSTQMHPPLPATAIASYRSPSPVPAPALQPPPSPNSPSFTSSQPGSPDAKRLSIMEGPKLRKYSFNAPWDDVDEKSGSMSARMGDGATGGVLVVGKKGSGEQSGRGLGAGQGNVGSKEPTMVWNDVLSGSFLNSSSSTKGTPNKLSDGLFGGSTSTSSLMGMGLGGRFHLRNPFGGGNTSITASDSTGSGQPHTPATKSKIRRPNTSSSSSSSGSKFTLKGMSGLGGASAADKKGKISSGDVTSRRNTMILPGQVIGDGESPAKSLEAEVSVIGQQKGMSTGADSVGSMGSLVRDGAYAVFTADTPAFDNNRMASSNSLATSTDNLSAHRFDDPPGTTNSMMSLSAHAKPPPTSPTRSKTSSNRFSKLSMSPPRVMSVIAGTCISDDGTASSDNLSGITPMTEVPQVVPVRKSPSAQKLVNISTGESEMQLEQSVNLMMGGGSGTLSRGRSSQQLALNAMAERREAEEQRTGSHSRSRSRTMTAGGAARTTERKVATDAAVPSRSTMYASAPAQPVLREEAITFVALDTPSPLVPTERMKSLKPKRSGIMRLFGKDNRKAGKSAIPDATTPEVERETKSDKENSTELPDAPEMPPTAAEMIKQAYQAAKLDKQPLGSAMHVPLKDQSMPDLSDVAARDPLAKPFSAVPAQMSDSTLGTPRRGAKIARSNSETSPKKFAHQLGKVRPISMMFPDMHGSPERSQAARMKGGMPEAPTSVASYRDAGGYISTSVTSSSFQASSGSMGRPQPKRMETQDSFATARSGVSQSRGSAEREEESLTIELLQNQLVNARKAWHIQIIELEAQIRDLKRGVEEAREEQLTRLKDGSCPQCGCKCKSEEAEREKERMSFETARTASAGANGGGGSVLNRGRAKTGGARGVFGTGDLKQWS